MKIEEKDSSPLISVSWLLTSKCNYNCPFCFKVINKNEVTDNEAEIILRNLVKSGVKKISFTGGEPLLWRGNLARLIKLSKSLGVITMLITNGSLLNTEKLKLFSGNLDWITLPLDGSDEEKQILAGRPPGHYSQVIKLINQLKDSPYKLKINSIICKKNYSDIEKIAQLIKKGKISRWKVFQFFPIRGVSLANKSIYEITNREFNQTKEKIKSFLKPDECSVYFASIKKLETSYLCINPNGMAYITKKGRDYNIGDLKKQSAKNIWENATQLDKKEYFRRTSWFIRSK